MADKWLKPFLTLLVMGLLAWFLPSNFVDPWNLVNPKKIATVICVLAFIQSFGSALNRVLGARVGAILTGLFGGLVSSTATTASLARKSKAELDFDNAGDMLVYLSATGAMLIEGFVLVWTGTKSLHFPILAIFVGPFIVTIMLIYFYSSKLVSRKLRSEEVPFEILPFLKLTIFIVFILISSKLLQNIFGQTGLIVLTFLVSLFEIHGSIITNVQLYESGTVTIGVLGHLIAISIVASYLSKIFLISTFGHVRLRFSAIISTTLLFLALSVSWIISVLI